MIDEKEVEELLEDYKDNLISKKEFSELLEKEGYKLLDTKIWRSWWGCRALHSQFPNSIAYYKLTPENTRYKRNWGELYILLTEHTYQVKKFRFNSSIYDWRVVATNIKDHELFTPNPCKDSEKPYVSNVEQSITNTLIEVGG